MAKSKRPSNPRVIPEGKVQVNFNVDIQILEKAKAIAGLETLSNSEVFNTALEKFVELYEAKHGKVKIRPKGKGLEGL